MIFSDRNTRLRTNYAQFDAVVIFPEDRGADWIEVIKDETVIIVAPLTTVRTRIIDIDKSLEAIYTACLTNGFFNIAFMLPNWFESEELLEYVFGDGSIDITLFEVW